MSSTTAIVVSEQTYGALARATSTWEQATPPKTKTFLWARKSSVHGLKVFAYRAHGEARIVIGGRNREQFRELLGNINGMPYAALTTIENGVLRFHPISVGGYNAQMMRGNSCWDAGTGDEAWYSDDMSEGMQERWHVAARMALAAYRYPNSWHAKHLSRVYADVVYAEAEASSIRWQLPYCKDPLDYDEIPF